MASNPIDLPAEKAHKGAAHQAFGSEGPIRLETIATSDTVNSYDWDAWNPIVSPNDSDTFPTETVANDLDAVPEVDPIVPSIIKNMVAQIEISTRLTPLQRWEGCVVEVDKEANTFRARLADLDRPDSDIAEEAKFYLSDIDPDDEDLVRPGGVFRWTIGYRDRPSRERVSSFVFRRLPAWTRREIAEADERANKLLESFEHSTEE